MTPVSRIRHRARSLLLAPLVAVATLLTACSDEPPIAPDQEAQQSQQPLPSGASLTAQSSFRPSGAAATTMVPSVFTPTTFAADFVVTGAQGGTGGEHYFPSNGNGTFGTKSNIPGLGNVDGLDVDDLDGDGDNDFLACDGNTGEVYRYINNGSGSFAPSVVATGVSSASFCTNLRVADFDADGRKDFVVGDEDFTNGVFVYLQTAVGTFTKVMPGLDVTWTSGDAFNGVAAGDVDGDGHQDVLLLGFVGTGPGKVWLYKGDGTGAMTSYGSLFSVKADFGTTDGTCGLALFDLEGDGDLDIVVGGEGGGAHYVYTNNGSGSFTKPSGPAFDVNGHTGIDAFDADGDGDHDLLVATFAPEKLYLVSNQGGSLAAPALVDNLDGPSLGVGAPPIQASEGTPIQTTTEHVGSNETKTVTLEQNGDAIAGAHVTPGDLVYKGTPVNVNLTVSLWRQGDAKCPHLSLALQDPNEPCLEVEATVADGPNQGQPAQVAEGQFLTINQCQASDPANADDNYVRWDDQTGPVVVLREPSRVFVDCTNYQPTASAAPRNWLEGLAMGVTKRLTRWISPKPLYAADRGFGGDSDHITFFGWASNSITVNTATLETNVSGKDRFSVSGVLHSGLKTNGVFNPTVNALTLYYGNSSQTIPTTSWFVNSIGRWAYTSSGGINSVSPTGGGLSPSASASASSSSSANAAIIEYVDIHPTTGEFSVRGRTPAEGDALPTFRPYSARLGNPVGATGLLCAKNKKCTAQHP